MTLSGATFSGKTMFISGASRGIGLAIAKRVAADGANVALVAKTTEPHPKLPGTIYTAAKEIEEAGGHALPIVGDVRECLTEMLTQLAAAVDAGARVHKGVTAWWTQIAEWRKKDCLKYDRNATDVIKPQFVIEKLWEVTGGDAFVTSDVGQHQMWAAQFYRFDKPRRWINSGGLGTMGVGLPYAMGVALANPGAQVACVTGEGSIQMCIQELSTCLQYNTAVKVVSLNNRYLGMVRQWQQLDYGGRYSHSYMDALPDFVKLAEAYGHVGFKIERPADVEGALREAIRLKDRTVFLDIRTDQEENVWPMVKAGKGISEMLLGSEDL
jgi:acetolactate synthase-1/2/3 large subunit